ncbi:DUF1697 domain-containing protein [Flavobacteriaceae sp. LMIT009]
MIYIALLRGINVSGQKKILMADLRNLLSELGLENVKTYIQSGNVIFETTESSKNNLELQIHNAIKSHYEFDVRVIVKKPEEIKEILEACPFTLEKKQKSYFTMLHSVPDTKLVEEASQKQYQGEEYYIINNCIYFYCASGVGKAKFNTNFFERKLNTTSTTRNYNTMMKLLSLSAEM